MAAFSRAKSFWGQALEAVLESRDEAKALPFAFEWAVGLWGIGTAVPGSLSSACVPFSFPLR